MKKIYLFLSLTCIITNSFSQSIKFREDPSNKKIDVLYKGKLLTSYCYGDSIMKPVLYPVNTVSGTTVTRGYPNAPRPGERTDHPHHIGLWLNYESVNGIDFWNNSTAIAGDKKMHYGKIIHKDAYFLKPAKGMATLASEAIWTRYDSKELLKELTHYEFAVKGKDFIIDRTTTLTALDTAVLFKDVKDGMLAIRVARELELPSKEPSEYIDDKGNVTKVDPSSGSVTGNYITSAGQQGDAAWSSKGEWCMLQGEKDGKAITIAMVDHPYNPGYPSYWHARGYGLFAMNPLGRKVFSNGSDELNLRLEKGQSATFRYRVIIHEGGKLSAEEMNALAKDFN